MIKCHSDYKYMLMQVGRKNAVKYEGFFQYVNGTQDVSVISCATSMRI